MERPKKAHPIAMFSAWFLVVFLVLFPKGGIKAGSLPLTWGYMFLGLSTPVFLVVRLLLLPLLLPLRLLVAIGLLIPMQLIFMYSLLVYGVVNISYAFSLFVGLFALPWIFLLVYPPFLQYIDGPRLSRCFRWCILLAAIWGIFLFFYRPFVGHFIEIPFLTVNAADYGQLENTKHIARGFFLKLISTYNNGNLYGVATLMLYPIYKQLERVRWRRGVVTVALLLTLARTVWAGLIIVEALPLLVLLLRQVETFPVLYLGKAARRVAALVVTVALVFVAVLFSTAGGAAAFLFDPSAGGRVGELAQFRYASWLPEAPISTFDEIVYASAAVLFGWVGFAAFTLIMISPLLILLVDRSSLKSPIRRAAFDGLILYAIIAWSDGAFILIPVMAFYWFTYMIYLFGWPEEARTLATRPAFIRKINWRRFRPRLPQASPSM